MPRRTTRLSAVFSVAALGAGLAFAGPAQAEMLTRVDPPNDMVFIDESNQRPAPEEDNGDVTQVVARHASRTVQVRMDAVDLRASSEEGLMALVRVRTSTGANFDLTGFSGSNGKMMWMFGRTNGERVRCEGLERSVNWTENRADVSIPRRCLGRPAWVRIAGAFITFTQNMQSMAGDDAFTDGEIGNRPRLSRRLARG